MGLIYFTQGLEIVFILVTFGIITKMYLDERKEIKAEIEQLDLEENTENLVYLDEYREEA